MALTRDFRETVQARAKRDPAFRKGLLSEALESYLSGEATLGRELLRDYINATIGFPRLAAHTGIHVKTLHQMFGPQGNPTFSNLSQSLPICSRRKACAGSPISAHNLTHQKAAIAAPSDPAASTVMS